VKINMRLFVAIELPPAVKESLGLLVRDFSVQGTQVRWVRSENVHLTLKFLGEVEEQKIQMIAGACRTAAGGVEPFEITVEGVGAFPSRKKPRVIWVGVTRSAPLKTLHGRLEEEFKTIGFPQEKRSWSPHLTIGRVKVNWNLEALENRLSGARFSPHSVSVDRLHVVKSDLRPDGPLYTTLEEIHLEAD
jgi:2'-5' RNA ligase